MSHKTEGLMYLFLVLAFALVYPCHPTDASAQEPTIKTTDDGPHYAYASAQKECIKTGKPILILVGAEWCPPCQVMKKTIIPEAFKRGLLKNVLFSYVNVDEDKELTKQLIAGASIPQLVFYYKESGQWHRVSLIGQKSVDEVGALVADKTK